MCGFDYFWFIFSFWFKLILLPWITSISVQRSGIWFLMLWSSIWSRFKTWLFSSWCWCWSSLLTLPLSNLPPQQDEVTSFEELGWSAILVTSSNEWSVPSGSLYSLTVTSCSTTGYWTFWTSSTVEACSVRQQWSSILVSILAIAGRRKQPLGWLLTVSLIFPWRKHSMKLGCFFFSVMWIWL